MSTVAQLLCFAKAPELGRVKTRLAASIGADDALIIYNELLRRTATVCNEWSGNVHVFRTGTAEAFSRSPLAHFQSSEQYNGNLGERLFHGTQSRLPGGPVVIIGTDCPFINKADITALEDGLIDHDVSIGPANDGGYWGIALKSLAAASICFAADLPWSQEALLDETESRLSHDGLSTYKGAVLDDLDNQDDLQAAQANGFPSLSELQAVT